MGGGTSFGVTVQAEEMVVLPSPKTSDNSISRFCSSTPILVKEEVVKESLKVECVGENGTDEPSPKMQKTEHSDNEDRPM